ncbi:protein kinase [Acidobacteriota bacterium]
MESKTKQIDQYVLLNQLGKGGMGEVFLAYDTVLDRKVAIKFLPPELQDDKITQERFFREAQAAAALDHPFICKIYQTGEVDGRAYIAMEYVEGKELHDHIKEANLSLKETFRLAADIASALEKAHNHGIVHRDLKPANIMLTPQGHIKIMDFGLAKRIQQDEDGKLIAAVAQDAIDGEETVDEIKIEEGIDLEKTIIGGSTLPPVPPDKELDLEKTIVGGTATPSAPKDEDDIDPEKTIITSTPIPSVSEEIDTEKTIISAAPETPLPQSDGSPHPDSDAQLTQHGTLVGTLAYMSPEQALGKNVDMRSDIFSFGVILYEMIAKKHPFLKADSSKTITSLLKDPIPSIKIKPKKMIGALNPIFRRALAKDVTKRYQNIKEFIKDIQKMEKVTRLGSPLFYLSKSAMISAVAILIVATIGIVWLSRQGMVSVDMLNRESVSVLVADFRNMTGDAVFDGALEQALSIGLEESSFIMSYKRPDAHQIAENNYPESEGRLDAQTAQLICIREGISMYIDGIIEKEGDEYIIQVWTKDPTDPKEMRDFTRKVSSRDEVLGAASWLSKKIRSGLGDRAADSREALEMETFTTNSLEAMNAYTKAQELYTNGRREESIVEYQKAIEADPDFGRAYSGLALSYQNSGQYEEAEEYFDKALSLIDKMSDREKYRTRAIYFLIRRDYDKAIEECTKLVEQYPADHGGITNLALAYFFAHNFAKAKEFGNRAVELLPRNITPRFNLSWYALVDSDAAMAEEQSQEVIAAFPEFEEAYVVLALAKLIQGHVDEAVDTYTNLKDFNVAGQSLGDLGLADTALYQGRISDAVQILENRLQEDGKSSNTSYAGNKWGMLAKAYMIQGKKNQALQAAEKTLSFGGTGFSYIASLVFIHFEEYNKALEVAYKLGNSLSKESVAFAKLIEGEISLKRGENARAKNLFDESVDNYDSWLSRFALGRAYLLFEGYEMDAHAELDACVKRRGETTAVFFDDVPSYHFLPDVYYYIGLAQKGIGSDEARESFQKYLDVKSDVDWDNPLVRDARAQLDSLDR